MEFRGLSLVLKEQCVRFKSISWCSASQPTHVTLSFRVWRGNSGGHETCEKHYLVTNTVESEFSLSVLDYCRNIMIQHGLCKLGPAAFVDIQRLRKWFFIFNYENKLHILYYISVIVIIALLLDSNLRGPKSGSEPVVVQSFGLFHFHIQ